MDQKDFAGLLEIKISLPSRVKTKHDSKLDTQLCI